MVLWCPPRLSCYCVFFFSAPFSSLVTLDPCVCLLWSKWIGWAGQCGGENSSRRGGGSEPSQPTGGIHEVRFLVYLTKVGLPYCTTLLLTEPLGVPSTGPCNAPSWDTYCAYFCIIFGITVVIHCCCCCYCHCSRSCFGSGMASATARGRRMVEAQPLVGP